MSTVHAIDWGDVPTWVSAITTLGALIAAGIVVRVELRRDKDGRDRLERSEQADKVAAWSDWDRDGPTIRIHNGSALPVFGVVLQLSRRSGHLVGQQLTVLSEEVIPPGDVTVSWPSEVFRQDSVGNTRVDDRSDWLISLSFIDASSRAWERHPFGELRRA